MKFARSMIIAAALLGAQAACAHGIWTEQRYGHLEVAYLPEKVKGVWAYDQHGDGVPVTVQKMDDHARLKPLARPAVVTVALDNGVWTKNSKGESVNKPMAQVPGAVSASHSYKYNLAILEPHARLPDSLKLAMVIRPLKDPLEVGVGNPLPVEVTIDGKPAEGIALFDDYRGMPDTSSVKTDAKGRATLIIRNSGLNIIAAQAKVPAHNETGISERSLFSSTSFVGAAHQH